MKLTIMLMLVSAAFVAFAQDVDGVSAAQDFNGVTLGGAVDRPTIVNNSRKPVMGWIVAQNTTNGARVNVVLDMSQIAKNDPIPPGGERLSGLHHDPNTGHAGGLRSRALDQPEDLVLGYTLVAVLFADGSYIGPDQWREVFSERIAQWRSTARDTQYLSEKYQLLEEERRRLFRTGRRSPSSAMAIVLLAIRDTKGEAEAEAALARLASLPEVKGENQ